MSKGTRFRINRVSIYTRACDFVGIVAAITVCLAVRINAAESQETHAGVPQGSYGVQWFKEEYAAHRRYLEDALKNMRCSFAFTESFHDVNGSRVLPSSRETEYRGWFYTKGEALEVTREKVREDAAQPSRTPDSYVVCASPERCFELGRYKGDPSYHVSRFDDSGGDASRQIQAYATSKLIPYFEAAFRAYEIPIQELVRNERLKAVGSVTRDGREYIECVFEFPNTSTYKFCKVLFDPELHYAVKEYDIEFRSDSPDIHEWRRGRVGCERMPNGYVLATEVHINSGSSRGSKRTDAVHEARMRDFSFDDVTDSQFTLSAFGLPDISLRATRQLYPLDRWYFWCLALTAIAGWLFLRRKARAARHLHAPEHPE